MKDDGAANTDLRCGPDPRVLTHFYILFYFKQMRWSGSVPLNHLHTSVLKKLKAEFCYYWCAGRTAKKKSYFLKEKLFTYSLTEHLKDTSETACPDQFSPTAIVLL